MYYLLKNSVIFEFSNLVIQTVKSPTIDPLNICKNNYFFEVCTCSLLVEVFM